MVATRLLPSAVLLAAAQVVHANFVSWVFETSTTNQGGVTYSVIDVYAQFDNSADTILNVFNLKASNVGGAAFHHDDLNILSGLDGSWSVQQTANLPSLGVVAADDSFVLIGGPIGSTNTTSLDPNFSPSTAATPPLDAGWFNSNPPNLQGRCDPATLRTFVARMVIAGSDVPETLSWAANAGYNQGIGTNAQFVDPDPIGSGAVHEVGYVCPDSDGDGANDCVDGCPNDPGKTAPGACGCGVPDADSDGDGTPDCIDGCPSDPDKTSAGACGCGVPDTDSDGDGTPDCNDGCPSDPNKTSAGACGCGVPDADSDGDGTLDCNDGCPNDPGKTDPGVCGCGVPDADSDGDGTLDCNDGCPSDPGKTAPGACGCGVADTDSDGDGTPDCTDGCPSDPDKTEPGICGCGLDDDLAATWYPDSDGDGYGDAGDGGTVACSQPTGFVLDNSDCDDSRADVNPAAEEVCDNGIDDNCNGIVDSDCVSSAEFLGWVAVFDHFAVDGIRYVSAEVYAEFDEPTVEVVNVYDSAISTGSGTAFEQHDYAGGTWTPSLTDPATEQIDSYVLIGGNAGPAAGNTTTLDPDFGGGTAAVPPVGAGWYNSNPANLQGLTDPTTSRVRVAQFVMLQPLSGETLLFAGSLSYALFPDGPAEQRSGSEVFLLPDPPCPADLDGSGTVDGADLGLLLLEWGSPDPTFDLDGNGLIDGADLGLMLLDWGPCL